MVRPFESGVVTVGYARLRLPVMYDIYSVVQGRLPAM